MSVEICDLTCSRCGCTLLLKYSETNRKGQLFKLCNGCRGRGDTNAAKETKAYKKALEPPKEKTMICRCGCVITKDHISAHLRRQKHKQLLEWVEQGLDPKEEETRADREALLKRIHDYNNAAKRATSNVYGRPPRMGISTKTKERTRGSNEGALRLKHINQLFK